MAFCTAAIAQTLPVADLSTPKGAVRAYFTALQAGDADAAKSAAIFSPDRARLIEASAAGNRAKAQLIAAAGKRWGQEQTGRKIGWAETMLVRMVDKAEVKEEGDRAAIGRFGDFFCTRVNNQWRFDLTALRQDEPIEASIERCRKSEETDLKIAKEIEEGRFNSLDEVVKARSANIPPPPPPPPFPSSPASQPAP